MKHSSILVPALKKIILQCNPSKVNCGTISSLQRERKLHTEAHMISAARRFDENRERHFINNL